MRILLVMISLYLGLFSTVVSAESYPGVIDFRERATLGTTVNGTIESINVATGDRVKKGQVLIALDETPFRARQEKYKAALQYALTEQRKAKRDQLHTKELYDRAALSTVTLEDANIRLQQATAAVEQVKANLKLVDYELSQSKIIAPFDGWVMQVNATRHQSIVNNLQTTSLVTLASADRYVAQIHVPLAVIKKLQRKKPAQVQINGVQIPAQVATLSFDGKPLEGKNEPYFAVSVEFESASQLFVAGETAMVDIN